MTATVIQFTGAQRMRILRRLDQVDGMSPEHLAFCLARQQLNKRFLAWLQTHPDVATIQQELDNNVLQQIFDLTAGAL